MKERIIILLLVFTSLFSCNKKVQKDFLKLQGDVFGTTYNIVYEDDVNYQKSVDSIFNKVNNSLSTYLPTSDISRINRNEENVLVDDLFTEVFEKAKRIYKETDGYFDPTLAPLIDAYGFGSGKQIEELSVEKLKGLMALVGFEKVELKNRQVYKTNPKIQFNVNAFAKGYALDVVGRFFERKNIQNYLIEIGGEIRVKGLKKGNPWKIAIDKPNEDGTRSVQKIINLTNKSMATSGNYRKYRIAKNGEKYVHTINAKTGLAQPSNLLSVSVIANLDCADVDAYATAFMAMGLEKTKDFLNKYQNLKVILMYLDEKGKIVVFKN